MGLNCCGWPKKSTDEKVLHITNFLEREKPDVLIVLETHATEMDKLSTYHGIMK